MSSNKNRIQFRLSEPYHSLLLDLVVQHPDLESPSAVAQFLVQEALNDQSEATSEPVGQGAEWVVDELRDLRCNIKDALLTVLGLVPLSEQNRERAQKRVNEHFHIDEPN